MRPRLLSALLGLATAPLKPVDIDRPPTPEEFARNLIAVTARQPDGMRAVMVDAFGATMADHLADAYRPDVPESAACAAGRRG